MFSSILGLDSYTYPREAEFEAIKKWLLHMAKLKEGEEVAADIPIHFVEVFTPT
jgi:hypothetical protein